MKEKILDIAKQLYHNHLTPEMGTNLILNLLITKMPKDTLGNIICPKCENPYPHSHTNGTYSCEECGYKWK